MDFRVVMAGLGIAACGVAWYVTRPVSGVDETFGLSPAVAMGSADPSAGTAFVGSPYLTADGGTAVPVDAIEPVGGNALMNAIRDAAQYVGDTELLKKVLAAVSGASEGGCCVSAPSNTYVTNYTSPPLPEPMAITPMSFPQVTISQPPVYVAPQPQIQAFRPSSGGFGNPFGW